MKKYVYPEIEVITILPRDVITLSVSDVFDGKSGTAGIDMDPYIFS
ncbi:MAG: hypothetical protein ACI3XQ_10515 [Eubacteriales bacterium]